MDIHSSEDNKLGFGMMRLPVRDGKAEDVDIDEVTKMGDLFLHRGFTYFDTSYVYHNGRSENAVKESIVEKHPRDAFQLATKFPTMLVKTEDQVEGYFEEQLSNLGVEYVDMYLLHILGTRYLDPAVSPAVVPKLHLFDHLKAWKESGRAKHIGFSFHDTSEVLDQLLTDHPEVDAVQIIFNYYDWDSEWIQSKKNYEVIRKHGKAIIAMEPVKGGYLANVPDACLELMHQCDPKATPASWAVRFAASFNGVFKVLSGMSTMAQVEDNTSFMDHFKPLTDKEKDMLFQCAKIMREQGPVHTADYSKYAGLTYHGLPVSAILQTYNAIVPQPDPYFAADNNYVRQELMKLGCTDPKQNWPEEKVVLNGQDITAEVAEAYDYLTEHMFA